MWLARGGCEFRRWSSFLEVPFLFLLSSLSAGGSPQPPKALRGSPLSAPARTYLRFHRSRRRLSGRNLYYVLCHRNKPCLKKLPLKAERMPVGLAPPRWPEFPETCGHISRNAHLPVLTFAEPVALHSAEELRSGQMGVIRGDGGRLRLNRAGRSGRMTT
jgi:hypothetical protein